MLMAMTWESFCFVLPFRTACMHWPLAQPFHVAWADSTGQCLVYISLMSMAAMMNGHDIKNSSICSWQFYLFADLSAVSDEERKKVL